jgi:hypothetical protein
MTTTVISVNKKELKKIGYKNLKHWLTNPKHVYIGRDMSFYVHGAKGSKWANIFQVKKFGRDTCLILYEDSIRNTPELMNSLKELKGKVLGCWCKPESCHGDVLVKLINETCHLD